MIYSQSFFFSALREDSSKSNSRGGQGVIFSTSWQSFVARGASANLLWQGGRCRAHSKSLHLGREVPVYAF